MGGLFETSTLQGDLLNNYNKQEVIDYNVYGVTHRCQETKTNKMVALKIINKKYLEKISGLKNIDKCIDSIRQQIAILRKMDGDYSLHLIGSNETSDFFYIITEIWDTNLEKYIRNKKEGLKLVEIKKLFKMLNIVFKRMEKKKIIHGNLKLSNILIKKDNNKIIPLICEYGEKGKLNERLNIMPATSQYSAPEILEGENYDNKADLWSIGIILYRLYFNEFPFNGDTQVCLFYDIKKKKNLKKCEENFYFNDLIKRLLVIDPNYRMTWDKYFQHKFWESDENNNEDNNENVNNMKNENFNNMNKENINNENTYNKNNININNNIGNNNNNKNTSNNNSYNNSNNNDNIEKENEKTLNEHIKKKEYKYLFKKNKNPKSNKHKNKLYSIYYSSNDRKNQIEKFNNKNIDGLQKIEISVEKDNEEESTDDLIFHELTKRVQINNLSKLILYGYNIKNIDILTKIQAINLQELDLSRNKIDNIESLSNIGYNKLTTLNLSNNNIYDISPLIKASFENLKNLNLSHNLIGEIEPLSQVKFYNLDKLKLSNNKIRNIEVFSKVLFINLTFLDLSKNEICEASKPLGFISIQKLLHLDLSHNSIKTIEGLNVGQYQNLITLELGDNKISNIDLLKYVFFGGLIKLSLYDNKIENGNVFIEVPFINLKELNLSYNKLENIEFINYISFKNLEKLDLNGNHINNLIPLNQLSLNNLKELELKHNQLKQNEDNYAILDKLKKNYSYLKVIYI